MMMKIILSALLAFGQGIVVSAQDTIETVQIVPLSQFSYEKPLFRFKEEQLSNKKRFLRYAAMTGYREGILPFKGQFNVNFGGYNDEVTGTRRICMYNLSVVDMLTHGLIKPNQIILEVNDPSKYRYDPKYGSEQAWLRKNGYCFEMLLPLGALKGVRTIDNELQRIFSLNTRWEEREVKTWVLVRTSAAEKFKSSGGEPVKDPGHGVYRNVNVGWIGAPLNESGPVPFLDETGYKEPVDLDLGISIDANTNISELRKVLRTYDLDLKEEMRKKQMFVIRENKQP
jgi:hypothetical protein